MRGILQQDIDDVQRQANDAELEPLQRNRSLSAGGREDSPAAGKPVLIPRSDSPIPRGGNSTLQPIQSPKRLPDLNNRDPSFNYGSTSGSTVPHKALPVSLS